MSLSLSTVPGVFPLSCSESPKAPHDLSFTRQKACPVSCPLHTQGEVCFAAGSTVSFAGDEQHTLAPDL